MKMRYQLGLLFFVASCIISVAKAKAADDVVLTGDEIANATCGAAAREYEYTVTNNGDRPVFLTGAKLFVDQINLPAGLITLSFPTDTGDCFKTAKPYPLLAGDSCQISVLVDPTTLYDDPYLLTICQNLPAAVSGELEVYINNAQREVESDFDFDISFLGSLDDFAIVGNNICSDPLDTNCTINDPDTPRILTGEIQSWTNAAATGSAEIPTSNISFASGRMYTNPADLNVIQVLAADLAGAIINFENVAAGYCMTLMPDDYFQAGGATHPLLNPGDTITVLPGVYCYDEESSSSPFTVDLNLQFTGDETAVFIFVLESEDDYTMLIDTTAGFDLDTYGVSANNIYWTVIGNTEIAENASFVGNILTTGYVESDAPSDMGTPAEITGRILSQQDVLLEGNAVLTPFTMKGGLSPL